MAQPTGLPALPQRADITALVRRLEGGSDAERAEAVEELLNTYESIDAASKPGIEKAIAAAGGIPTLLQMMGSPDGGPGAAHAACLLAELTGTSPAACSDVLAADGISPLVSCMSSGFPPVQANAAAALGNIASSAVMFGGGGADAVAAAAVPAAIECLSSSQDKLVLRAAAFLLRNAATSDERVGAIGAAGAIPPLLRLMRHRSPAAAAEAGLALTNLTRLDSNTAVFVDEGGIPLFVDLLAISANADVVEAAGGAICSFLLERRLDLEPQIIQAGGITALVRCLRGTRFTDRIREQAATSLGILAGTGPQASGAIAEAGGAHALVQALGRPCSPAAKEALGFALLNLLQGGQAAAVAAADPMDITSTTLRILPTSQLLPNNFQTHAAVMVASAFLANARRDMPSATATATATAAQPPSAAGAPAEPAAPPPRICAAPGCGATSGLRRCPGCNSVLYCSKGCMSDHHHEHRAECRRIQAERAAGQS